MFFIFNPESATHKGSDFSKWRVKNAILDDCFYIIPETDFFGLLGLSQKNIYDINVSLQTHLNRYIYHGKRMQLVCITGSINKDVPFFVDDDLDEKDIKYYINKQRERFL